MALRQTGMEPQGDGLFLLELCHAFASTPDSARAVRDLVRWAVRATGAEHAVANVYLPDGSGRLRLAAGSGDHADENARSAARRSLAFSQRRTIRVHLGDPQASLLVTPLVSRGESLGVLEVVAPRTSIGQRRQAIEAVASQAAITLKNNRERGTLRSQVERLEQVASAASETSQAGSRLHAARQLTKALFASFAAPIAVWVAEDDEDALRIVAVRGLGRRRRAELRARRPTIPRLPTLPPRARDSLIREYGILTGERSVEMMDEGSLVLLVGSSDPLLRDWLDALGSSVREVLTRTTKRSPEERMADQLELGIAWAAHELRAPLIGAQAVVERAIQATDARSRAQPLLRRSQRELRHHGDLVDLILSWSADSRSLRRRPAALNRIVQDAIRMACVELDSDRVVFSSSRAVVVRANRRYLVVAIANLIRNALAYSQDTSEVRVRVDQEGDLALVVVKDRGSGVSLLERDSIFEPFVRGRSGWQSSRGAGLGLFIAHQVVQAHQGRIWFDSSRSGTTFHIELPAVVG